MMKALLAVLLFVSPMLAQGQTTVTLADGGCGPSQVEFDVKTYSLWQVVRPRNPRTRISTLAQSPQRAKRWST